MNLGGRGMPCGIGKCLLYNGNKAVFHFLRHLAKKIVVQLDFIGILKLPCGFFYGLAKVNRIIMEVVDAFADVVRGGI